MTTAQLIILCLAALALSLVIAGTVLAALAAQRVTRAGAGVQVGATLVVHTLDGRSLRGTVVPGDDGVLALQDASYLQDGQSHPVGGTVRVPVTNLSWTQDLTDAVAETRAAG